jgi:hypothetical protein
MENKKMFDETLDNPDTSMVKLDNNEGKDTQMTHQHYWDTPAQPQLNLVAECACGEQLERVSN